MGMYRYRGKLLGATLGFSFGGPIGAIVGASVGHFFDSSQTVRPSGSNRELAFVASLIYLLVGTARSDGPATLREIATIRRFFQSLGYGKQELALIGRIIDNAVDRTLDLARACRDIHSRTSYEERLFLVRLSYEVALSDGKLKKEEEDFIRKAVEHLHIEEYDHRMVRRMVFTQPGSESSFSDTTVKPDNPYEVLGIHEDCSREDVVRAYRDLAAKYHPDKVSHLGEELIELATEKFRAIQNAYDLIVEERGIR